MVEGKTESLAQERETTGTGTAVIDIAGCTIGSTAVLAGILAFTGEKGCGKHSTLRIKFPVPPWGAQWVERIDPGGISDELAGPKECNQFSTRDWVGSRCKSRNRKAPLFGREHRGIRRETEPLRLSQDQRGRLKDHLQGERYSRSLQQSVGR